MKTVITFEIDESELSDGKYQISALSNALSNQIKIDGVYEEIFRPVLKYENENDQRTIIYQEIWDKLEEYLFD